MRSTVKGTGRFVSAVAIAALAAGCGEDQRSAPRAEDAALTRVEGRVTRTSGRTLVLRAPGREELELRVPDGTEVTFGEVHLTRGAVRPGSDVRASYAVRDGTPTAVAIDVVREGGAWMSAGSEMREGVSPDFGGSVPAHRWEGRAGANDHGPAATSGGGDRSGGAAGGGIHGPERIQIPRPPLPAPRDAPDPRDGGH
jgi:hypothetical protein